MNREELFSHLYDKQIYDKQNIKSHGVGAERPLAIYVHIPFCISRCIYCGFYSKAGSSESVRADFARSLAEDIRMFGKELRHENYLVDTIFFGGGTPSILEESHMEAIVGAIDDSFRLSEEVEMTIESNPKTLNFNKLKSYRELGFNRLSMGLQSTDANMLKFLSRAHSREDFMENYGEARRAGFDNINVDLMFGLPLQTMEIWENTLKEVCQINPEHISLYSLQIEEGTKLYQALMDGEIIEISDELDRNMYHRGIEYLRENGYEHYEISNFSKEGFRCRHNLKYWDMSEYLGFGPSSSSFIKGCRFKVDERTDDIVDFHRNSTFENYSEYAFTGLRRKEGIIYKDFFDRYKLGFWEAFPKAKDELKEFFSSGIIVDDGYSLRLTEEGFDVSNEIFLAFI